MVTIVVSRNPVTPEGYEKLKKDLVDLKSGRSKIAEDLEETRSQGDLSENAGYDAAKEKHTLLETKIQDLENYLGAAEVIDTSSFDNSKVRFGATVELEDEDGENHTYKLVGEYESDISENKISYHCPVGHALIGKSVGDEVSVQTPKKLTFYEIISIKYN